MNCASLISLLDETPLTLWTSEQKMHAAKHCELCDDCRARFEQEEALFMEFRELTLPQPATTFEVNSANLDELEEAAGGFSSIIATLAALVLSSGSLYQAIKEDGFSFQWFPDGSGMAELATLLTTSPEISLALVLLGLIYCLGLKKDVYQK